VADTKISALTAASTAASANELAINEAGASKKLTLDQVQQYLFTSWEYAIGSFTIPNGQFSIMTQHLILTTTQRGTIQGTGRLRIT